MLSPETIENLKKLAKRKCWIDQSDFMVYDYAGGNIDDAYAGGAADGEASLARSILEELKISWK